MSHTLPPIKNPSPAHTPWETVGDADRQPAPRADAFDQRASGLEITDADLAAIDEPTGQADVTRRPNPPAGGGLLTIPLLCLGLGMIACCVLIPAADENRRLAYERLRLRADLDQIGRQIDVNDEFLKRVADDPTLSERLAQRQMKMVRQGTSVLELKGHTRARDMSPFELTTLPPPPQLAPYQPLGGKLSDVCRNPHLQLYMMGAALLLVAAGLVLGSSPPGDVAQ